MVRFKQVARPAEDEAGAEPIRASRRSDGRRRKIKRVKLADDFARREPVRDNYEPKFDRAVDRRPFWERYDAGDPIAIAQANARYNNPAEIGEL